MCAAIATLKASQDFRRIAKEGQKWVTPAFILQVFKKDTEQTPAPENNTGAGFRLGLTVSRKVGNAVARSRTKRRLREMVRAVLKTDSLDGYEIVLIGRTAGIDRDFARMQSEFRHALKKLGVLA